MKLAIAIFVLFNYRIQAQSNCGRRLVNHQGLIVGGNEAKEGFWPWHVNILHIVSDWNINYKCGGTLLNSNAVLTAAHCVYENGGLITPYRVVIQMGQNNIISPGPNTQSSKAFGIIPHPSYNSSNLRNDIAIILLATQATFSNYIQPICLWNGKTTDLSEVVGKQGVVVGFGVTETDNISNTLREIVMPVVSLGTCLVSNNEFYGQFLSDFTFCAGSRNGATACNGDSGGGMVFENDGVYQIRGIVSLSPVRSGVRRDLCNVDEYVVFTDVAKYLPWIELNVPGLPLKTRPTKGNPVQTTTRRPSPPVVKNSDGELDIPRPQTNEGTNQQGGSAFSIGPIGDGPQQIEATGCVPAIVNCCTRGENEIRYACFEQFGCHGPFWVLNPCGDDILDAAQT